MKRSGVLFMAIILVASAFFFAFLSRTEARPAGGGAIAPPLVGTNDIGGLVTSAKGSEAGVWVIAETTDLPTKFIKIVVTDDQGRYLIPELPKANYKLWVRGYGLVDSKPVQVAAGKTVNLTAVVAPSRLAAAQYYPAEYWYSMLHIPPKSAFPMEEEGIQTQEQWIDTMKGSLLVQQIGDKATREIPEQLGKFQSSQDAWRAWLKSGESAVSVGRLGEQFGLAMYADWTDRIAAGEYPKEAPPRPQGVERNVVITEWDWSDAKGFIHDEITTDKRKPTVNANGLVYGLEQFSADVIDVLDPATHSVQRIPVPVRDKDMPPSNPAKAPLTWGNEDIHPGIASLHNPMMDQNGRLWITAQFRMKQGQPDFCKSGSSQPSAQFFPLNSNIATGDASGREVELYDPETKKFTMIDTCFGTQHLEFATDADNTIWFSGGHDVVGWLNTKVYEQTGDAAKAQGWCPYILDTNGNGKVDEYVDIDQAVDSKKDKRYGKTDSYGIATNPVDGTVWQTNFTFPGSILRTDPGSNPPYTCKTEVYNSPTGSFRPKGIDIDRDGTVWVTFAGSGGFAKFDRRKCAVLNGRKAIGDHCPEGWTVYPSPAPKFQGVTDQITTDYHYLGWIDQFDTLGLGKNVPIAPGSNSDSVVALIPNTGKFVVIRVPYPLGYYSRGEDGRIDDPRAGWKGKGLWSTYASISPWHYEGGKGASSKVVKFQVRPDPLAH